MNANGRLARTLGASFIKVSVSHAVARQINRSRTAQGFQPVKYGIVGSWMQYDNRFPGVYIAQSDSQISEAMRSQEAMDTNNCLDCCSFR